MAQHRHITYHFKGNPLEISIYFKFFQKYFDFAILQAIFTKWVHLGPIFRFQEAVMNFGKYTVAHILAKFKYFAKQIIFSNCPARKL